MKNKTKKLYRNKKDKIIAGVCSGIGEYTKVDSNIIRLLWVVGTFLLFGAGIIAYLIAWIILPGKGK